MTRHPNLEKKRGASFKGKKHSDETKLKMSAAQKRKTMSHGIHIRITISPTKKVQRRMKHI